MEFSTRGLAVLAVTGLIALTLAPSAHAQVPLPPTTPRVSLDCPTFYFTILVWLDDCKSPTEIEEWPTWVGDMDIWLRCEILGGAACTLHK